MFDKSSLLSPIWVFSYFEENLPTPITCKIIVSGHFLSAASQPFMMFAPTKVAAVWFADNQRALANTIVTTCNPLGILAANILSPLLVRHPEDILMMLLIYLIPAGP